MDDKVWLKYIKGVKQLQRKSNKIHTDTDAIKTSKNFEAKKLNHKNHDKIFDAIPHNLSITKSNNIIKRDLQVGQNIGVTNKLKKYIDSGKYAIDDILDLHGFNLFDAHSEFVNFIYKAKLNKNRMVLVITGKGTLTKPSIINQELHKWVNEDSISGDIIYFQYANIKHGGKGAFYILLAASDK